MTKGGSAPESSVWGTGALGGPEGAWGVSTLADNPLDQKIKTVPSSGIQKGKNLSLYQVGLGGALHVLIVLPTPTMHWWNWRWT